MTSIADLLKITNTKHVLLSAFSPQISDCPAIELWHLNPISLIIIVYVMQLRLINSNSVYFN